MFIYYLSINYIAIDLTNSPQILFVSYLAIPTPEIEFNNQIKYVYISFTPYTTNEYQIKILNSLVGHYFLSAFYNQVSINSGVSNSTHYYIKINQVDILSSVRSVSLYMIGADQSIMINTYKTYVFAGFCRSNNQNVNSLLFNPYNITQDNFFVAIYDLLFQWSIFSNAVGFTVGLQNNGSLTANPSYKGLCLNTIISYATRCTEGYYFSPSGCVAQCNQLREDRYCLICINYCTDCINTNSCRTCANTRQLTLDGTQCVCKVGYGDKGTAQCLNCESLSIGCLTCDATTALCLSCSIERYFQQQPNVDGVCICPSYSQLSSNNTCECVNQSFRDASGNCTPCYPACSSCNGPSASECLDCDEEVFRFMDGTSCSCNTSFVSLCTSHSSTCNASVCYFDPSITVEMNLIDIVKDSQSNTLTYTISLLPVLQLFSQIDYSKLLSLGYDGVSFASVTYDSNGVLTIIAQYTQDVHNKNTQLTLSLLKHGSLSFSQTSDVTVNYVVTPSNDLVANYYLPVYYSVAKNLKSIIYGLLGLALAVFIAGLYSSKMVVSEMVGIIQLAYFGIFLIDYNSPMIVPMAALRYSNGYNDILPKQYGDLPLKIKQTGYDQLVVSNLNAIILLSAIPLITSFFFFILARCQRKNKERNYSYCKLCLGEWTMVVILFLMYNISASTAALALYSTSRGQKFILSIVEIGVCFGLIIFMCLMYFFTDYNYLGEFKYMFKWSTFQLNYYFFQIAIRIIAGGLLVGVNFHFASGIIVTVMFLALSLVTAITNPFADKFHTIRSSLNTLIGAVIIGLYTLCGITGPVSGSSFQNMIPLIVVILLFLVVAMALGFVIRQYITSAKVEKQLEEPGELLAREEKEQEQFMRKQIEQAMKDGAHNSFARKLYIEKNKRHRRKKKALIQAEENDECQQTKDFKNKRDEFHERKGSLVTNDLNQSTIGNNRNSPEQKWPQLTVQRFHMVDQMLKDGLI